MTSYETRPGGRQWMSRRTLFKAAAVMGGGLVAARALQSSAAATGSTPTLVAPGANEQLLHLAATDGWASMPADAPPISPFWPDPLAVDGTNVYVFGFRDMTHVDPSQIVTYKGQAQICAPLLAFDQYDKGLDNAIRITLSNLGLSVRPDLTDGHTIHWHGFNNAIPLFDGVPELSISVPIGRDFTYYYRAHDPGTYMYHCHFEDVEHVQMGMTGVVYVRPHRNVTDGGLFAYDHAATRYDREYAYMLTELWAEAHYRDAHIQTTDWTDYKPSFFLLNGRSYPDTLAPSADPLADGSPTSVSGANLKYNPISSVAAALPGEIVLLRLANLGYEQHAMTLDGLPMKVIAKDSTCLFGDADLTYDTNTVEIGPGESRDVLVTIPTGITPPSGKHYASYPLYDRNYAYLNNRGGAGYGGQLTEVRVYDPAYASDINAFKQTF